MWDKNVDDVKKFSLGRVVKINTQVSLLKPDSRQSQSRLDEEPDCQVLASADLPSLPTACRLSGHLILFTNLWTEGDSLRALLK